MDRRTLSPRVSAPFLRPVPWLYGAGLAACVAELSLVAVRAPEGVLSLCQLAAALAGAQFVAFLIAALLAALATSLGRVSNLLYQSELLDPNRRFQCRDFAPGALLALVLAWAGATLCVRAVMQVFANQELAALLAAAVAVGCGLAGAAVTALLAVALRNVRERWALGSRGAQLLFWLPGGLIASAVLLYGAQVEVTGVNQLDPGLLAAPLSAAVAGAALGLVRKLSPGRGLATPRGVLGLGIAALSLAGATGLCAESGAAALLHHGAWSKHAIPLARAWTDFDGDGYSAWFGGGDCAGWNDGVHPGALERPGNGVDDNCTGGDVAPGLVLPPPRPSGIRLPLPQPTNVVLVTIETLRADRVSFLGYHRPTTPRLARLAEESVVFERFYATTPTTRLSLPALLSGRMPSQIAWQPQSTEKRMRRIGPTTPWLPEILRARGYRTIAVHTTFRAFSRLESAGFDRGFEIFDAEVPLSYSGGTMRGFPGARQVDRALEILGQGAYRPFFLWLHLVEPHYLYEQPPEAPRFGSSESDLYDAEIAEADRQVGRLLDKLSERSSLANSIVLVCGDHGEEFGEHGERWHTSNLYEPQVRTAAVLRIPRLGPRRVRTAVAMTDLAPTLLDLLGVQEGLAKMQGRNLLPLLESPERELAPFFLENFSVEDGRNHQVALVSWPRKLIHRQDGGSVELYELATDPHERRNLYATNPESARDLLGPLLRFGERIAAD